MQAHCRAGSSTWLRYACSLRAACDRIDRLMPPSLGSENFVDNDAVNAHVAIEWGAKAVNKRLRRSTGLLNLLSGPVRLWGKSRAQPGGNSASAIRLPFHTGGSSLNGLNTFKPGRRKSLSFPVTIVRP